MTISIFKIKFVPKQNNIPVILKKIFKNKKDLLSTIFVDSVILVEPVTIFLFIDLTFFRLVKNF